MSTIKEQESKMDRPQTNESNFAALGGARSTPKEINPIWRCSGARSTPKQNESGLAVLGETWSTPKQIHPTLPCRGGAEHAQTKLIRSCRAREDAEHAQTN